MKNQNESNFSEKEMSKTLAQRCKKSMKEQMDMIMELRALLGCQMNLMDFQNYMINELKEEINETKEDMNVLTKSYHIRYLN